MIGTDIWKGFGYNTVVYLAAILGVDKSLYEAAAADGAGRFKRIWHVTLPGIRTTVALLAITHWYIQQEMLLIHGYTGLVYRICSILWQQQSDYSSL